LLSTKDSMGIALLKHYVRISDYMISDGS